MLIPRQKVPALKLETLEQGMFDLTNESNEFGTLIVAYRGLHCPICANYLKELDRLVPEFQNRGISVIAISSDEKSRAQEMSDKIENKNLRFGYGFSLKEAREWGLAISTSRGKTSIDIMEPVLFSEPGIFIVKPDQTLYWASVQTMPFVRPSFRELLAAIDFAISKEYPARGEYVGEV